MAKLPAEEMPEFHRWASERALSYQLNFSEAEGVWEVEIHSPASTEQYYEKRCYSLRTFMEHWEKRDTREN